jgi:hypothetical protein
VFTRLLERSQARERPFDTKAVVFVQPRGDAFEQMGHGKNPGAGALFGAGV